LVEKEIIVEVKAALEMHPVYGINHYVSQIKQ
jgi:hypothetical protein